MNTMNTTKKIMFLFSEPITCIKGTIRSNSVQATHLFQLSALTNKPQKADIFPRIHENYQNPSKKPFSGSKWTALKRKKARIRKSREAVPLMPPSYTATCYIAQQQIPSSFRSYFLQLNSKVIRTRNPIRLRDKGSIPLGS